MKFLIDAQLPVRLAQWLERGGHDCIHTSELPDGNRTTDRQIVELSDAEDGVVVTKDRDFRDGHLLHGAPRRLWLISTGNITNDDLLALVERNLEQVIDGLKMSTSWNSNPTASSSTGDRTCGHRNAGQDG